MGEQKGPFRAAEIVRRLSEVEATLTLMRKKGKHPDVIIVLEQQRDDLTRELGGDG